MQSKVNFEQVWIQDFPSPRQVAIPKFNISVWPRYISWGYSSFSIGKNPALYEMLTGSAKNWTRISVFIPTDYNHYTTISWCNTSMYNL